MTSAHFLDNSIESIDSDSTISRSSSARFSAKHSLSSSSLAEGDNSNNSNSEAEAVNLEQENSINFPSIFDTTFSNLSSLPEIDSSISTYIGPRHPPRAPFHYPPSRASSRATGKHGRALSDHVTALEEYFSSTSAPGHSSAVGVDDASGGVVTEDNRNRVGSDLGGREKEEEEALLSKRKNVRSVRPRKSGSSAIKPLRVVSFNDTGTTVMRSKSLPLDYRGPKIRNPPAPNTSHQSEASTSSAPPVAPLVDHPNQDGNLPNYHQHIRSRSAHMSFSTIRTAPRFSSQPRPSEPPGRAISSPPVYLSPPPTSHGRNPNLNRPASSSNSSSGSETQERFQPASRGQVGFPKEKPPHHRQRSPDPFGPHPAKGRIRMRGRSKAETAILDLLKRKTNDEEREKDEARRATKFASRFNPCRALINRGGAAVAPATPPVSPVVVRSRPLSFHGLQSPSMISTEDDEHFNNGFVAIAAKASPSTAGQGRTDQTEVEAIESSAKRTTIAWGEGLTVRRGLRKVLGSQGSHVPSASEGSSTSQTHSSTVSSSSMFSFGRPSSDSFRNSSSETEVEPETPNVPEGDASRDRSGIDTTPQRQRQSSGWVGWALKRFSLGGALASGNARSK